ncbi:MAG: MFS transporter [Ruminococcaceae bacterium]|nr:MFS transporter [Oscillospiraceae bacterium]
MENKEKESFSYTYSAGEREEIRAIRQKYAEPAHVEDKMAALRRLDASVGTKATVIALVLGVLGALVLGFGMSLIMTELGTWLGLSGLPALLVGVLIGAMGIISILLAYPAYNRILRKERERIAPEIIRLTDELMK